MALVIAGQPLHLSELVNLLAVRKGVDDHSNKRVPEARRIEQICGKFVTLDRSSKESHDDPLLKFFHKSVYEFFTEDPEALQVSQSLKKYFVKAHEAHLDMGEMCISYLSYARYSLPIDLDEVLETGEHAFLKYAATFWFQHLHQGTHSQEVYERVCSFVQSPNFWNCMATQTKINPYLFSIYSHQGGSGFKMGGCEDEEPSGEDGNNYADPLPSWLDEYGPLGKHIVEALHIFTKEWSPVLTRYPEAIDQCMMHGSSMHDLPARAKFQAKRVRRFAMQDLYPADNLTGTGPKSKSKTKSENVQLDIVKRAVEELGFAHYNSVSGGQLGAVSGSSLSDPNSTNTTLSWSTEGKKGPHNWSLDLRSLNLRHPYNDSEDDLASPKSVSQLAIDSEESNEKSWTVFATDVYGSLACGDVVTLHCLLLPRGKTDHHDGNSDSGYESADSESDSDDSDEDSEEDSDSDSDDSDEDDSDENASESESESEAGSSQTEDTEAPLAENDIPHCFMLLPKNGKPIWSLSSRARSKRQEFAPAFHPSQALAVWSQGTHELKVADLENGSVRTEILPEPGDAQLSSAAIVHKGKFCICVLQGHITNMHGC